MYKDMKAYKIISSISAPLIIMGAVMQLLHIKIGISGKTLYMLVFCFSFVYQSWYISKLHKQLKNKEQNNGYENRCSS